MSETLVGSPHRSTRRHAFTVVVAAGVSLAAVLSTTSSGASQDARTFVGVVTDERCAVGGHAAMRMGPTDAECAKACADEHGDALVLLDGEHIYQLSDQKLARTFAGEKVRVTGVLDVKTGTIAVTSIQAERQFQSLGSASSRGALLERPRGFAVA